jgi:anti-sigma regulatory factor (Ser/Thr protein kinase)
MNRDARDVVELRIPSQLRFLGMVDAVVQAYAADLAWEPDDLNNLSTAAIEAASNAMEHGNAFAADKWVVLRIAGDKQAVDIEVEDQGDGFDHRPYERELTPEDLLKLRGRGIFIMRSFMDEVSFASLPNHGTRVRLRKRGTPLAEKSGGHVGSP